jgi:hypothetical protein
MRRAAILPNYGQSGARIYLAGNTVACRLANCDTLSKGGSLSYDSMRLVHRNLREHHSSYVMYKQLDIARVSVRK